MSYLQKGIKGVFILLVLSVLGNFIGYLTRLVLTKTISVEEYGLFYAVLSLFMFLMIFTNLGFGSAVVKYVSEFNTRKKQGEIKFIIFYTSFFRLAVTSIISLILFLSSGYLSKNYFSDSNAKILVILFAIGLFFMTINQILTRIFNAFKNNFLMGILEFTQKMLFFILVIISLIFGFKGIFMPVYSFLISIVIVTLFFFFLLILKTDFLKYKLKKSRKLQKKVTLFALASFLTGVGYTIIGYIDTLMLTYFSSLKEVGIYNVVLPTIMMFAFFGKSIYQVFLPIVSEMWSKNIKNKIKTSFYIIKKYSLFIITPFTLILFIFPKIILNLLFGSEYVSGYISLMILSIGIIFLTISFINQSVLTGIGKPEEVTKILIIGSFFNIITNLILIPFFGIIGAAITTTLSYLLIMILTSRKLEIYIHTNSNILEWIKLIICSILFITTIQLIKSILILNQYLESSICLFLGIIIYILFAYLINLINLKEITFITKSLLKI
jgi:stage V sporulation protein B